jgi:predicted SAM-dependent methyltransferase
LPMFPDNAAELVCMSHVLEHVRRDDLGRSCGRCGGS